MKIHHERAISLKPERSKRRLGSTRRRGLRVELLEERRVLDASMPAIDLLPNWFETVNSRYEAGFEKQDVYGPIRWIEPTVATIQLTDSALAEIGSLAEVEAWFPDQSSVYVLHGLGASGQLAIGTASRDADATIELIRSHPYVARIDLSVEVFGSLVPDDPQFDDLHGLSNSGQNGGNAGADVDAPLAWEITTGSLDNVVAVIDSGVDYTHPDLFLNIWINQGEIDPALRLSLVDSDNDGQITFRDLNQPANNDFVSDHNGNGYIDAGDLLDGDLPSVPYAIRWEDNVDGDANGLLDDLVGWDFHNDTNDPFDDHGHGTHVTGTIAAVGNNGTGVAGLNWQAQVMPLKFLGSNNRGSTEAAITAINYAKMMRTMHDVNLRATNNSWVSPDGNVPALKSAIADSAMADILVVAAAGNGNAIREGIDLDQTSQKFFPASYPDNNIISVAAGNSDDTLVVFSNFGATSVDVLAPGVGILSARPGGVYASRSGTSMATPHVTGAAMLVWANVPDATMSEVRRALLESVDTVSGLTGLVSTGGRLNARGALTIDTFTPRASLLSPVTVTADEADQLIEVIYSDDLKLAIPPGPPTDLIYIDSLSDSDLIVVREDDPDNPLDVVFDSQNVSPPYEFPSVVAPYIVSAPGGTWDKADNGTYEIRVRGGEVSDINGNSNLEILLGSFEVNILFAGQIEVTTTADGADSNITDGISDDGNGNSTLRSAIQEANTQQASDPQLEENTIVLTPEVYTLSVAGVNEENGATGDLDVTGTLTIIGNGATIDADSLDRVFDVKPGAILNLRDVTITGGDVTGNGGGIRDDGGGTINLIRSTISGNTASGDGGAIYSAGNLIAENTTFSGNTADTGGGITLYGATLDVRNSTITGNTALGSIGGGGLYIYPAGSIHNSIIAGNISATDPDVSPFSDLTGSTFNLFGVVGGSVTGISDGVDGNQVGSTAAPLDPLLGPLQSNTGLTFTHALLANSPAIDAGDNNLAPSDDQRNISRPLDANRDGIATADIGAIERFRGTIEGISFIDRNGDGERHIATEVPFVGIHEMTGIGDDLFFSFDDGRYGRELWRLSDGTAQLVADLYNGPIGSFPTDLVNVNGVLFFAADNGLDGSELWKSDGTREGTVRVRDIRSGALGSGPTGLVVIDDEVYFSADDGNTGNELWKSNGTHNGTLLVSDLNTTTGGSFPQSLTRVGSSIVFTADNGVFGRELWSSQGTPQSTTLVSDTNLAGDSNPGDITDVNGDLFFSADDGTGVHLFSSASPYIGKVRVTGINGVNPSNPSALLNAHGTLLFAADGTNGRELFKSESPYSSASMVADINPNAGSSNPAHLTAVGENVFFAADDGSNGVEVWKTNGTSASTSVVSDLNPGGASSSPSEFLEINGDLLFAAQDGTVGSELFSIDGASLGVTLLADIRSGALGSSITDPVNVNGKAFFFADNGTIGSELWTSDGTSLGTNLFTDTSEPGLSGKSIFLDINNNAIHDIGEPITTTQSDDAQTSGIDETGRYSFEDVAAGAYAVRSVNTNSELQTSPSSNANDAFVTSNQLLEYDPDSQGRRSLVLGTRSPEPLGDVNGDGIDDVGLRSGSRVYVFYGNASGLPDELDVTEIENGSSLGFAFDSGGSSGIRSLRSPMGDINGDGFDEIGFGASGRFQVIFGRNDFPQGLSSLSTLQVLGSSSPRGLEIPLPLDPHEENVDLGDINADGFADIGFTSEGQNFLVFGATDIEQRNISISTIRSGDGTIGAELLNVSGDGLSGIGDVNADGVDDFIAGLTVVFGRGQGFNNVLDVSEFDESQGGDGSLGFRIVGLGSTNGSDRPSGIGDFNGDDVDDFSYRTTVFYGSDNAFPPSLSHSSIVNSNGQLGFAIPSLDNLGGRYLSPAGDFNGDGFSDLLISTLQADSLDGSLDQVGIAYLLFGDSENSVATYFSGGSVSVDTVFPGLVFVGSVANEQMGFRRRGIGDVNADGFDDVYLRPNGVPLDYIVFGEAGRSAFRFRDTWSIDLQPGNRSEAVDFGFQPLPGEIRGFTFRDLNNNARRDAGEFGLQGLVTYIDANDNGELDEGETSVATGSNGAYSFSGLTPLRSYVVRQVLQSESGQSLPGLASGGAYTFFVDAGEVVADADFGYNDSIVGVGLSLIKGRLWDDQNADGSPDEGEPGINGETVFVDLNNNGTFEVLDEPSQTTKTIGDDDGAYEFSGLGAGVYTVRLVKPADQELTTPLASSFTSDLLAPGESPQAIESADLNGDGFVDLIVINFETQFVSILMNNGDGTFASRVEYETGILPISIAVGDVDGVNGNDLIIGHQWSSFVSVLKNNGDGTFGPRTDIPTPRGPVGVAVGDMDGINGIDIVVANQTTDRATVLYNNGSGGFSIGASLPVGDGPYDVTVGQFDFDPNNPNPNPGLDIAVVNSIDGTVSILLNTGNKTFFSAASKSVGSTPVSISSGDLDGDNALDLVVANVLGDSVSVLFGNGNGIFQNAINLPAGLGPASVTIADINSDNRPDLLVTNGGDENLAVLKNLGNRTFQSPENFGVGEGTISLAWGSAAADFNADGVLDVAVANGDDDSVSILSNTLVDGSYRIVIASDDVDDVNFGIRQLTNQFMVNTTADTPDANPGDGMALDAAGNTSLRAAIEEANATANLAGGPDIITFDITGSGPHTINVLTPLPAIMEPLLIDGTSEPDYSGSPVVILDGGSLFSPSDHGLSISTDGVIVDGLLIEQFPGDGIQFVNANGGEVRNTIVRSNDRNGIYLENSADVVISQSRIVTNGLAGVQTIGALATGNQIVANSIGVDDSNPAAPVAAGNLAYGVLLSSPDNVVQDNTISGNAVAGVLVTSHDNMLLGNRIGTNALGTAALSGQSFGVVVRGFENQIGGTDPGDLNVISGNTSSGVYLLGTSSQDNVLTGNHIGVNLVGDAAIPNGSHGIFISGGSDNQIGGSLPGQANVISGNSVSGVFIIGADSTGNTLHGNLIGLDHGGTMALPNLFHGVHVKDAADNFIGGSQSGEGNVISGNAMSGVIVVGRPSTGNQITGNTIGLTGDGMSALGNAVIGIQVVFSAQSNEVRDNLIAGNGGTQIGIRGGITSFNTIAGNHIGFASDLTTRIDAGFQAILLSSPSNTIGGPDPQDANVITGSVNGLNLTGSNAKNNVVQGNLFGTNANADGPQYGMSHGIRISDQAKDNQIGPDNTIAFSTARGIFVTSLGNGNQITQNEMFSNVTGILLSGPASSSTDPGDGDEGPNSLQNTATSLVVDATTNGFNDDVDIQFDYQVDTLTGNAAYPLTIEFFLSDSSGQGIHYLTSDTYTTPGTKSFSQTFDSTTFPFTPDFGTATVTDANGNTSEFAVAVPVSINNGGAGEPLLALPPTPPVVYDSMDVNQDRNVTALDALFVINALNARDSQGEANSLNAAQTQLDVNGDGQITALDALSIINRLNAPTDDVEIPQIDFQAFDDELAESERLHDEALISLLF